MTDDKGEKKGVAGLAKKANALGSFVPQRRRSEPGVVPSVLTERPDPRGLSVSGEVSYAQRYAIGVPRLLARKPGNGDMPLQKTTKDETEKQEAGQTKGKPPRKVGKGQLLKATPNGSGLRSSESGVSHKLRSLLRTNTNVDNQATKNAKHDPNRRFSAYTATKGVPDVHQLEDSAAEASKDSAKASSNAGKKASLAPIQSMERRPSNRPKRLTNSASKSSTTSSPAPALAAQEQGDPKNGRTGNDSTSQARSLPACVISAEEQRSALKLVAQPEGLALTARCHSTPESPVLAFESRTERLLNQHKRIEEQHNNNSAALPSSLPQGDGRIGSSTLKKRPASSPALNPIPSRKVLDFSAANAKANQQAAKKAGAGRASNKSFMTKFFGCFACGSSAVREESVSALGVSEMPAEFMRQSSDDAEAEPKLTAADLLRKSITLLSSTSTPRASIGASEQLLDPPAAGHPAILPAPIERQAAELEAAAEPAKRPPWVSGGVVKSLHDVDNASVSLPPKAKAENLKSEATSRKRELAKRYGVGYRAATAAALQKAVSTNFTRNATPTLARLEEGWNQGFAKSGGVTPGDKLQAQAAGGSRVGQVYNIRRTSDGGKSCYSVGSKPPHTRHSHDGALSHAVSPKPEIPAHRPPKQAAASVSSAKDDRQMQLSEQNESPLLSGPTAATGQQESPRGADEEVAMPDQEDGADLEASQSDNELLEQELQDITERALASSEAAAAALKVHEEECQALGGKRQGSGKMSATMQVPRVAQAQPWKISSRTVSLSSTPQKPPISPKKSKKPLPNRKPLYVAPASLWSGSNTAESPIKSPESAKSAKRNTAKKPIVLTSAFSVPELLANQNGIEENEADADSTLERLFAYQQPNESTFIMESMSSDTEEESNDANCNELSQDFLISAGSEADSQGIAPEHQASSGFSWAGFTGQRRNGDGLPIAADSPADHDADDLSTVEGAANFFSGLPSGPLSALQQPEHGSASLALQEEENDEAYAALKKKLSASLIQREIHIDVKVASQDLETPSSGQQTLKQPLPAVVLSSATNQEQVSVVMAEEAASGKQELERKTFWWLPGVNSDSRKKSGTWMPASAIVRSVTAAFDSSATANEKPVRHSATGRLLRA